MNGRRYFGTDGIRGRVGDAPITPDFCLHLGWAVGQVLASGGSRMVVIGKDTRISGYMFESALEAGLSAAGVDVGLLSPIPTPAVAYLTRTLGADAGIVISASHNPYDDNGIKFFDAGGNKLGDDVELAIEKHLGNTLVSVRSKELGRAFRVEDARGRYIEYCKSTTDRGTHLKGLKLVLDCAHGATYAVAPGVFSELGAEVTVIGASPNGTNINEGCGSTHPAAMAAKVKEVGADAGIAFDGDGDRVVMADANGEVVDGDELLYIIAANWQARARLTGGVVGTVMSNLGVERALAERGIPFARAAVGDRYVLDGLRRRDWQLGGESSGHIICLELATTGDGIVAALQVLMAMVESGRSLADLRQGVTKLPQTMLNVQVSNPGAACAGTSVHRVADDIKRNLASRGRILIRPSGTEPVVRVMVEGEDEAEVKAHANRLAEAVRAAAG